MLDLNRYINLKPQHRGYHTLILVSLLLAILGLYAAYVMEHAGHHITGMNNHIVWGLPHVFAIALIVTASGALNGASLSSVFGLNILKPYARFSVVLAMCSLVGGLLVLVLDLGRPDRLIVAMTTYNFRSVFAWNIFLYTGFLAIGVVYLWMMMEKRLHRYVTTVGRLAFAWRLILTTATGSIFGFLVGRNALDSALLAPLFIALSLAMGTALLLVALYALAHWQRDELDTAIVQSLKRLLVWFLIALVYFSVVQHITNLYVAEHHGSERFTLLGPLSGIFWLGHVVLGVALPIGLLVLGSDSARKTLCASVATMLGGGALIYVIVVGSQSTPQRLFPGHTVLASRFGDAGFAPYRASHWEWGLGLGGIAIAILLCLLILRILPLIPASPVRVKAGD
ncbi:MAG: polysulfide reductase NrfD [Granulosicoccus sp.]|nr:polysulfide reductase NrfD [Granulosicoccus sp.]